MNKVILAVLMVFVFTSPASAKKKNQRQAESSDSSTEGSSGQYRCEGKTKCGEMTSCEEAMFYLKECGVGRLDRDKDGVPCETICQ